MGGITQTFYTTTEKGEDNESINIELADSALSGISANKVLISNISTEGSFMEYFSITEIAITDSPSTPVPAPASLLLLFSGIIGVAGTSRNKTE